MTILTTEAAIVTAKNVTLTDDSITVDLDDGRTIQVPLSWYPRLFHGTDGERKNWRFIGKGEGIHWPDLDEESAWKTSLVRNARKKVNVRSKNG